MICPLCIDECEELATMATVTFPFCMSCLTTLRTFVRIQNGRRIPGGVLSDPAIHPDEECPGCRCGGDLEPVVTKGND